MEFDKWMNKRNRIGFSMAVEIAMREAFEAGAQNEREACAALCEETASGRDAEAIEEAIRARNK